MSQRETLPNRRATEALTFEHDARVYTMHVGRYADGRPAEVFVECSADDRGRNQNTTPLAMIARDFAVVLSIALQHGAPTATLRDAVTRLSDGEAASVAGAVLDRLCDERSAT